MKKEIRVNNFTQVKAILHAATASTSHINVHDYAGAIADAKSILGLMTLDYTNPVVLVSDNEADLERIAGTVKS